MKSKTSLLCALLLFAGCALEQYSLKASVDMMVAAEQSSHEEQDPELVQLAAPMGLKTAETLLRSHPKHPMLHLLVARGFVEYAYAFVQTEAERLDESNPAQARPAWARAKALYLRARDHALDGLELRHPGALAAVRSPDALRAWLKTVRSKDVPLLYFTGLSWGLAILAERSASPALGELPLIEEMMETALCLDETYDRGRLHEFFIFYSSLQMGNEQETNAHLARAMALSHGQRLSPLVSYADSVLSKQQNPQEFERLLQKVLAAPIHDKAPGWRQERLANILAQRRARWLLSQKEKRFAEN